MPDEPRTEAREGPVSVLALGRNSLVYAIGGLAYKGVALLSVPFLARLLSPAELGLLDLAAVVATLIGLLAVMGTEQGIVFLEAGTEDRAGAWEAAAALVATTAAGLAVASVVFQQPLAALITGDAANRGVIAAAGVYGSVMAASAFALNAVRLRGSLRAYAVASFLIVTSEMAAALVVAWLVPQPVAWMVLAWAVGAAIITVPVLVRYVPSLRPPRRATVWRLVRFGAPLVPAALAWLVGDALVRATLAREAGLAELGEYGIAYRIASVLGIAVTGFGVAWLPYLYRSPDPVVIPRTLAAGTSVLLALAAAAVTVTGLAPELVAIVAGPEYAHASLAVPALAGGMVALGGFVLISALVGRSGSTRRIGAAALLGAVIQVAMASLLVPDFGLAGASLASLAGYSVAAITLVFTEARLLAGRYGVQLALAAAAASVGVAAAAQLSAVPLAFRLTAILSFCVGAAALAWVLRRYA